MKCPECQSENPESNRFCGECGGKLEIVCPGCNSSNPPEFNFCGKCGSELPVPRKSPQTAPETKTSSRIFFEFISKVYGNNIVFNRRSCIWYFLVYIQ